MKKTCKDCKFWNKDSEGKTFCDKDNEDAAAEDTCFDFRPKAMGRSVSK